MVERTVEKSWRRTPSSRHDLTAIQLVVLHGAWEGHNLVDVMNDSVVHSDDAPSWNRKWIYVPEISAAAVAMLEFGFIEVHEGPGPLAQSIPLSFDEARTVLQDPTNWWSFDPDDDYDPAETAKLAVAGASSHPIPDYWIVETPSAPDFA